MWSMKRVVTLLSFVCIAGIAGVSQAAQLATPPFFAGSFGASCKLANVGTKARTVRLQLIRNGGLIQSDSNTITLNPGAVESIFALGGSINDQVYCHFIVSSKIGMRASGVYENASFEDGLIVPAQ